MKENPRKLAVITGVTRGLGQALAVGLAQAGWTVAGCGRTADRLSQLRLRFGPPHSFEKVDVRHGQAVRDWAEKISASLGPPHLLINNAALINRQAPLWEIEPEEFSELVDVNLKGTACTIRYFGPLMVQARRGIIVNFSSGWGRSTEAGVAPYCATKWAIEGLTQALAQELPAGLAAVALNPGIIDTPMLRSCFGASAANYPSPAAWAARAVPFILGLSAKHNGQALTVGNSPP